MATDINSVLSDLDKLSKIATDSIKATSSLDEIEKLRIQFLGRKSELTNILKQIKDLEIEDRKKVGAEGNKVRENLTEQITKKITQLKSKELEEITKTERIDVTLPGNKSKQGHIHPVTQMRYVVEDIFRNMGFEVEYAYEIDDDYHNFQTLNLPEGHPARDSWDTFWTVDKQIAVTHTSSMQNRVMTDREPPIRVVVPGRTFRNESTDARHEHTFTQVEGVYVDKGITFGDMLGTLQAFFTEFFEQKVEVKFSPDFFPFVEPGGMMSLTCFLCEGKGCKVCKYTSWLEILGCGMIHPKVLEMANIDPDVYSGFAWGFGLERLIMLKQNIEDVRNFNSGNLRFIRQF